ncbi:lactadherin-like [Penaeus chinensis]|uniref:lactadherin-like n=1 Tax=Penaeus chinensis TaxID=139456 RepID=UPI001FB587FB|nr:lactadherin-like [Penaeus chinensis]
MCVRVFVRKCVSESEKCKAIISEGSHVQLSASSYMPWRRRKSCQPKDAALHSHRAWCARRNNEHQWLQWDLGPPHLVTGVITRGRGDKGRKHWIQAYTLTYSNDSKVWFTYKDGNHLDTKVFGGNLDKHTERRHYLNTPFKARYIRLHPRRWHRAIAVRAALLGCPHKGDCGPGFFRVTPDTSCTRWYGIRIMATVILVNELRYRDGSTRALVTKESDISAIQDFGGLLGGPTQSVRLR